MSDLSSPADVRDFYDEAAGGYGEMMDGEIDLPLYAEELGGLVQRIESIEGANDLVSCFEEWRRVLVPGGQLLLATWEGEGAIDYGGDSAMMTRRYLEVEILTALESTGLEASAHRTREVDGMEMDAVYISATRARREGSDAS